MAIDPNAGNVNSNSTPVPAQTAANPAPAPPDVQDTSAPATPILPVAPPSGPPAPAPNANMDANAHHSVIGKIFQDIAGGQTTDYLNSPNGPVPVKRDLKPGEMARNILGAAFSLLAAGSGGAQAGLQGRQYKQDPNETIGGMERNRIQTREQQAQKVFENKQQADEATLRAHKDALEQQEAIANIRKDQDEHEATVQAREVGSRALDERAYETMVQHAQDYDKAMAMPGAEVMKDANGQELNFLNAGEAQAYAVAHPDILHGSTNGNSKYGVIPVVNPSTGSIQLIDYPAERHDIGIANFGQKKDKDGNPVFDKDGNPTPDGTVLDPKTKKPTVLTQTVTPDQARAIAAQNIKDADTRSQLEDREAQATKYRSEADKNEELSDATELFNGGDFNKMTARQKQVLARATFQQQTLASNREKVAATNLTKAIQFQDGKDDPEVKKAQAEYDEAKNYYEDQTEKYNQLTGNTAGVQLGTKIIQSGDLAGVKTHDDWNKIDAQIVASNLPEDEQQKARGKAWNAMSPAQQAAASGKSVAAPTAPVANAPARPANVPSNYLFNNNGPQGPGWYKPTAQ